MEKQLLIACRNGNVEEVQTLLNDHPQINLNCQDKDDKDQTPFYIACYYGHIGIVKLLLNHQRVDINKPNRGGYTPLYIACQERHREVVKLLINDERIDINKGELSTDTSPLHIVSEIGDTEVMKLFLNDPRVNVNKTNQSQVTPFLIACYYGHTEVVKLLLNDQRVDVNLALHDGETPLYLVCWNGFLDSAKYILASGREINLNAKNYDGKTAIDIARVGQTEEKLIWESEENFEKRRKNCPKIVELLELFERNPDTTRTKLRIQLGLAGKFYCLIYFFCNFFFSIDSFFFKKTLMLLLCIASLYFSVIITLA